MQCNVIIINNSKDRLNYLSHENELPSSHWEFFNQPRTQSIYRNNASENLTCKETEMNKCRIYAEISSVLNNEKKITRIL